MMHQRLSLVVVVVALVYITAVTGAMVGSDVSPHTALNTGGTVFTITGSGFAANTAGETMSSR